MKPSAYYDRVVDVMEELVKFTLLTRDVAPYLVDRYSERKESAEALSEAGEPARLVISRGGASICDSSDELAACRPIQVYVHTQKQRRMPGAMICRQST